jgi:hypothetical protein
MTEPNAGPGRPLRRPPAPRASTAGLTRLATGPAQGDVPVSAVQGTLALDLRSAAPVQPALYAVPEPDEPGDAELRAWSARFAQAVVEVTGGDRPLTQLLRWTSTRVYAELGRRTRIMAQHRPVGPRRRVIRPQVRSVHLCRPTPASAEVSVHVRYGQRSRALAARLEHRHGHWTCTALVIG